MDFLRRTELARDRVNALLAEFNSCSTSAVVHILLDPLGIKYSVCKFEDLNIECIKTEDDYIGYIYLDESNHLWADVNNEESIDPDVVLKYLLKKYKCIDVSINSDRTVMFKKAGGI